MKWLILFSLVSVISASVDPTLLLQRVHFIDKSQNNQRFLFRGNAIQVNRTTFGYDLLLQYLSTRAIEQGNVTLPQPFFLFDLSLLDTSVGEGEPEALQLEQKYFAENPLRGNVVNWPLKGEAVSPFDVEDQKRIEMAKSFDTWGKDRIVSKLHLIRRILHQDSKVTAVLYVHCGHGQDRTGQMAGGYRLAYLNATWAEVVKFNLDLGMDVRANLNALEWHCLYLVHAQSFPLKCTRITI